MHKAAQVATEKAQQADQHRSAINKLVDSAPRKVLIDGDNLENALALLTLLTAQLKKTLGEDAIKNMRRQQDVIEALNEASRKDQEKKTNEADEAQRKAQAASKAAGCISKTLGIIMLVVSVVATVVTFGTAGPLMMAVAAIGLAMAVADVVLEANGCRTLMEMAANEIVKGVSSLLIQCGVAPEKAKQIANIVGMVVAAVAFLALSLLSVSSFVKNAEAAVAKALQAGTKMAANMLKSKAKSLSEKFINILMKIFSKTGKLTQQFTKFAKNTKEVIKLSDVTARRIEMGTKSANMVMGVTKSAVGGGLNLYASAQTSDMKALLGALIKDNESIQAWVRALEALIKSWAKDFDQHSTDFDNMLTATNESGRTKANLMKSSYA
ncbi:type III secretion system translocon subunit SctE [Serratia symbiotica]|uniref:type III secretion system translocon subunit SctE n=1 Tax=Serratia symbiotica TaxID=138074 RepID=UPI0020901963|nr:type III secretion system translocon subunit SctE [Serratia symbiotica]USS95058.1 type III secretion system translocon subunit SctE [Serratia symbiotica]